MKKCIVCLILILLIWVSNTGFIFNNKSTFNITFIDVGQGDSALIECDKHYMLIDGGDKDHGNAVYDVLRKNDAKHLDILVASHEHKDHIGGFPKALMYVTRIDKALCNTNSSINVPFQQFINTLSLYKTRITVPKVGDQYSLGSAIVKILDVGDPNSDNGSIVLQITYGETTFLFTGDMGHDQETLFCNTYNEETSFFEKIFNKKNPPRGFSLLKVAHHGSDTSSSTAFITMVSPEYSVISVGQDNGYGHPDDITLSTLLKAGSKIYRTDRNGNIMVSSDGQKLVVKTSK